MTGGSRAPNKLLCNAANTIQRTAIQRGQAKVLADTDKVTDQGLSLSQQSGVTCLSHKKVRSLVSFRRKNKATSLFYEKKYYFSVSQKE
jgi:hypothetical protein